MSGRASWRAGAGIWASWRATGALQRRRKVQTSAALMRLVLAYSLWDWSLRKVGTWATVLRLAELSDVAVHRACAAAAGGRAN